MQNLIPDLYVDKVSDISIKFLLKLGIEGLIIDLDNTITAWNSPELKEEICMWFNNLKANKIKTCIASNNKKARVYCVSNNLGIPAIPKAGKPRSRAFLQAMQVLKTKPCSTAVVGDQIFTDVLGGKRLGLYTILVKPIDSKEFIGTRLMRQLEKIILRKI